MRTLLNGIGLVVAALGAISFAHGQRETEQFIPIGESPGISQKVTSIGEIVEANSTARTVTVTDPAGPRTVRVTDQTRIWLDRSKLKQTNQTGSFADLQKGRRVEVRYQDAATRQVADWIKVEVGQP